MMITANVVEKYGTKEEHIDYIIQLAKRIGYTPNRADIPEWEMVMIKKFYTSWIKIIRDAGLEYFASERQKDLRKKALDVRLIHLARICQSDPLNVDIDEYEFLKFEYTCKKKHHPQGFETIKYHSTEEEIQTYLCALANELGYSPTITTTCCAKQILKKYKTWFEALTAAGLELTNTEQQSFLRRNAYDMEFKKILAQVCEK